MQLAVKQKIKRRLRQVVDRVMLPYMPSHDGDAARVDNASVAEPFVFNTHLHLLRTIELQQMPKPENVLLSVGPADRYYFDWLEQSCGPIPTHVGVELYRPRPEELPGNVEWVEASASSMPQVADQSVDVLFSGQNIEHLSADDLNGFLLEAHRVIKSGGRLVIDSPNRLVTHQTGWRHPEHTIELSPAEARILVESAGFRVDACRGQWLCQDSDGTWLPLSVDSNNDPEVVRRSVLAGLNPERSFCWWIEATALAGPVDAATVKRTVDQLFDELWTMRVNRSPTTVGHRENGGWVIPAGSQGSVYRVGPIPLFRGSVSIGLENSDGPFSVSVIASDGTTFASDQLLNLIVPETMFGVWVDVFSDSPTTIEHRIGQVTVNQK
jgi:SAM-dependent methyltransferase